ncbi:MAG: hypothetical protein JWR20_1536, partial [Marmoricola sp.]|nr:hypothetical protein [Marmoricola sp.]
GERTAVRPTAPPPTAPRGRRTAQELEAAVSLICPATTAGNA